MGSSIIPGDPDFDRERYIEHVQYILDTMGVPLMVDDSDNMLLPDQIAVLGLFADLRIIRDLLDKTDLLPDYRHMRQMAQMALNVALDAMTELLEEMAMNPSNTI